MQAAFAPIHGARGVLIKITASPDVTLQEVNEAAELIQAEAHEDANIIWGMVIDPDLQDEVRVTVIATGFADTMEVKPSPIKNAVNDDRPRFPSFWQPKNVVNDNNQGMSSQSGVRVNKVPVIGSSISNDDHGIPPFLRKDMDKQK